MTNALIKLRFSQGTRPSFGQLDCHRSFGRPSIMGLPQPQPESRPMAGKFAKAKIHLEREGMGAGQDPAKRMPGTSPTPGRLADRQPKGGKNALPQHFSRLTMIRETTFPPDG